MMHKRIKQNKIATIASVIISLIMLLEGYVYAEKIKPFKRDGCSMFPHGSLSRRHCG